jgi:hypothetical protein
VDHKVTMMGSMFSLRGGANAEQVSNVKRLVETARLKGPLRENQTYSIVLTCEVLVSHSGLAAGPVNLDVTSCH